MMKALRRRPIALLWGGQALSAIGDEIYRVALIWLAVGLIGPDTGYLAAGQSAALLVMSLVGGRWADRWDHRRTMIAVDGLRAAIVLLPVLAARFRPLSLPLLVAVALPVSALSAFFDPALQATLPRFADDEESFQAANGLMSTTVRLARAVGPGLVSLLSGFVPIIHFFTLDAASFLFSALSVAGVPAPREDRPPSRGEDAARESLAQAVSAVGASPVLSFVMAVKALVTAVWSLAYGLGLALTVQAVAPGDLSAFGRVVAAYGLGNIAGALFIGNVARRRPTVVLFWGYLLMGVGFAAMGAAPSLGWLSAACVWAGFCGPINDVPFMDLVQRLARVEDIAGIVRLRMTLETALGLLLMAVSPFLFRSLAPRAVLALSGGVFALVGALGLARFGFEETAAA